MQIIGHNLIKFKPFYRISLKFFKRDKLIEYDNFIVNFDEVNMDFIDFCSKNNKLFSLNCINITQIVLANNIGARYIFVTKDLCKNAQKIANDYLFDSKIAIISDEKNIEYIVKFGVDCMVFKNAIIDLS